MSWRIAVLFFALALVTRAPFQTQNLWAHDSVLYERAIEHFDPLDQRPQPPGYLYYVLLIRGVDTITGDANRAMTVVSLLADAIAVALLYLLGARLYDERTARIAASFLLTAVTFWAYGGVAYPYTLLAALSIASALLFWRAVTTHARRDLVAASAFYGLAIGFRSDLAIFLAPLWLFAAVGTSLLAALTAGALVAVLVALWYLGTGVADGGLARFADALAQQGRFVDERYSMFGPSGLAALYTNVYELARFLGRGLYFLAPLLAVVPLSQAARRIELADRRRTLFVLLWTLTPLVIYVPIHSGEYGYVFSMLPGLALIAARGAIGLARGLRMPRTLSTIVGAVVLANSTIFLLSDTPLSARDVVRHDLGTSEKAVRLAQPDLAGAYVLAAYDALLAERYAVTSGPTIHPFRSWDPAAARFDLYFSRPPCEMALYLLECMNTPVVVVWDDLVKVSGNGWEELVMPHGAKLRVARFAANLHVIVDGLEVRLDR